jgi:hypothetical protein
LPGDLSRAGFEVEVPVRISGAKKKSRCMKYNKTEHLKTAANQLDGGDLRGMEAGELSWDINKV